MMRRPLASKLIFALMAVIALSGCSERVLVSDPNETDDAVYRRAKDMLARNLNNEALSNFHKLIAARNGAAPESHLEAGLIYLNHIDDPVSAYYHFNQYIAIKGRDPKSPSRDAGLARAEDLANTAMKELLFTEAAKAWRLKLLDTIQQLQDENEALKGQLAEARKGIYRESANGAAGQSGLSAASGASSEASPPAERERPSGRRTYVVKAGDTLYKISQQVYGSSSRWREILAANRAALPSETSPLRPGMALTIP